MALTSHPARRIERRVRELGQEARATAARAQRRARSLADDAIVFGVGAPLYAIEKVGAAARGVLGAPDRRRAARRPARRAKRALGGGESRSYDERTQRELYELAEERGIEGRSRMSKKQLIAALRR